MVPQYDKNLASILKREKQFYSFKRLELNLETSFQSTASLLLYFYVISETTTTNSLKAVFNAEKPEMEEASEKSVNGTWCNVELNSNLVLSNEYSEYFTCFFSIIPKFLPKIDPIYYVVGNFFISFLTFTK